VKRQTVEQTVKREVASDRWFFSLPFCDQFSFIFASSPSALRLLSFVVGCRPAERL
jgi:hypothetical protein